MGWMKKGNPGDSSDQDRLDDAAGFPVKSRWLTGLLLVFCCWHAVFLIVSIIPGPPARDDPGHPAMDFYRLALGGWQHWNMFETIPVLHSMDVRFEGEDEMGRKITAGCVLPGFQPYPKPEKARYYVGFFRLIFFSNKVAYRDAYLRKAAQLLPARPGSGLGGKWSLVVDTEYTRTLFHSRRGGHLSVPFTKTFDLTRPGADSP